MNGDGIGDSSNHQMMKAGPTAKYTGQSIRTMYSQISEGAFPRPIQLSKRRVAWLKRDLDEWLAGKIAARDGKAA